MASSTLLAQEIWDEIVDHLAGDRFDEAMHMADLQSASLICRSSVLRAQSHIFRCVSVRIKPQAAARVFAERLLNLMTASPHLIQLVKGLEIYNGDSETLHAVARIHWSHVYQLTLGPVEASSGTVVLENATVLVGLPSLRSLVFRIGGWEAAHLYNIFASCPSGLKRFTFIQCNPTHISAPSVQPTVPTMRARQTHIFLSSSSSIIDLLLEPTCPLDLSGLTHLRCSNPGTTGSTSCYVASAPLSPASYRTR
ncbi:hypothetical protein B0H11DRAFT_2058563 [Mycena galericulata]|nr:hypothetical protein B0H11DRAFT_2058563 [Mycena galericulata]